MRRQHGAGGDGSAPQWLFDFQRDPRAVASFASQDDRVMGGLSRSRLASGPMGAVFEGVVSFQQGGGFASVRTGALVPAWDLSRASGLVVRARGDGRRYKLALRNDDAFDAPGFMAAFGPPTSELVDLELPFERFLPTWRGRRVSGALDPGVICSVAVLCSKFEPDGGVNEQFVPGPFRLELAGIGVLLAGAPRGKSRSLGE